MRHAQFRIEETTSEKIVLSDMGPWDKYLTITNDAEYVVEHMVYVLNGRRLLYCDSENELTELQVVDGKFAGFRIGVS